MKHILFFLITAVFINQQGYGEQDFLKTQHDTRSRQMIAHVLNSIENAEKGQSKLTQDILQIEGMSSSKCRHLLNNLCTLPETRYLEIGSWKGSTWVSALYGNNNSIYEAVAIDNWFWAFIGGTEQEFLSNCHKFLNGINYRYFSENSFTINTGKLFSAPVNIYFYDGDHSALAQELALTYYDSILDDLFILLVDDWNWEDVRSGTFEALAKLKHRVLFSMELPSDFNCDIEHWWNGLYIAVIQKSK